MSNGAFLGGLIRDQGVCLFEVVKDFRAKDR